LTPELDELRVHFIDVGQGDAILVDFGETEILIDGGGKSPGVVTYLNDYVDGALEVMVATHPHADHIGGLIAVLEAFSVQEIWHNGDTSTSQTFNQFMAAVQSEGAEVRVGPRGEEIYADKLTFTILNPTTLAGTTNNNSLVLSLSYGEVDFLFMGDAEKEAEGTMLIAADMSVPDAEILKVGHHGSRTSSSQAFLALVKPEVAIYMAGAGNSYGHPHEETLNRLRQIGADIYGTDVYGTIIITTDGDPDSILIDVNTPTPTPSPTPTPTFIPPTKALPTLTTTPTPTLTLPPGGASNVQITYIYYDGLVPSVESDEYVEITNLGDMAQDLAGWVLKDIDEGYPSLTFPSYILEPGESIRVYTNEIHPEWGGFSFGYGSAVWNNSSPDVAALYNAQGVEVSRKSY
jgi:beta-lactamase superfamily II metal-dependent hydrolase